MKTDKIQLSSTTKALETKSDSSKLVSLLALAAGAAAMPQTSNADIIFTDQSATVNWEGLHAFVINNLPGDAQLGFTAHHVGLLSSTSVRYITGGKRGGGYLQFKLTVVPQGPLWSQIGAVAANSASFASAGSTFFNGGAFNDQYLAFQFKDSTQIGSPMRYGWAQLTLQNGPLSTGTDYPKLTVSGWAYDNTGLQIPMGAKVAVPEPSTTALLALGALALGARGVRSWRRNRPAGGHS
jgi:hypothetical protein